MSDDQYTFHFTAGEILEIMKDVTTLNSSIGKMQSKAQTKRDQKLYRAIFNALLKGREKPCQ